MVQFRIRNFLEKYFMVEMAMIASTKIMERVGTK